MFETKRHERLHLVCDPVITRFNDCLAQSGVDVNRWAGTPLSVGAVRLPVVYGSRLILMEVKRGDKILMSFSERQRDLKLSAKSDDDQGLRYVLILMGSFFVISSLWTVFVKLVFYRD